jgi:hypothetical protein
MQLSSARSSDSTLTTKRSSIGTAHYLVAFLYSVRLLGVTLDSTLSSNKHVTEVARSYPHHIQALRHIRSCLTVDTANQIASAIVGVKLVYCNSLLNATSDVLQCVQNQLAQAVLHVPWSVSATLCILRLRWLPIRQRIVYKTAMLVYNIRQHHSPDFLNELIGDYKSQRTLRSSSLCQLQQQRVKLSFCDCTLSVAAPRIWNNLTVHIKYAEAVNVFKIQLAD